jgi:hypothetical protein
VRVSIEIHNWSSVIRHPSSVIRDRVSSATSPDARELISPDIRAGDWSLVRKLRSDPMRRAEIDPEIATRVPGTAVRRRLGS